MLSASGSVGVGKISANHSSISSGLAFSLNLLTVRSLVLNAARFSLIFALGFFSGKTGIFGSVVSGV